MSEAEDEKTTPQLDTGGGVANPLPLARAGPNADMEDFIRLWGKLIGKVFKGGRTTGYPHGWTDEDDAALDKPATPTVTSAWEGSPSRFRGEGQDERAGLIMV